MSNRIRPIPLTFGVAVGSRPPYVELDASVAGDEVAQVARQRPFMVYRNLDLMMPGRFSRCSRSTMRSVASAKD